MKKRGKTEYEGQTEGMFYSFICYVDTIEMKTGVRENMRGNNDGKFFKVNNEQRKKWNDLKGYTPTSGDPEKYLLPKKEKGKKDRRINRTKK